MPISIHTFIKHHQGVGEVESLITKMYRTQPIEQSTRGSKYYSDKYEKLIIGRNHLRQYDKVFKGIIEYLVDKNVPKVLFLGQKIVFFNQKLLLQECAVFTQSFVFDGFDIGNCSNRSGFAAFKFHQIFQNTSLKVAVKSAKEVDQYVVYLGNKDVGWFIYDPLTNPELIFTFEEYSKEVLCLFTPDLRPRRPLSVTITADLHEKYQKVATHLKKSLLAPGILDVDRLLNDPYLQRIMTIEKIPSQNRREFLTKICLDMQTKLKREPTESKALPTDVASCTSLTVRDVPKTLSELNLPKFLRPETTPSNDPGVLAIQEALQDIELPKLNFRA